MKPRLAHAVVLSFCIACGGPLPGADTPAQALSSPPDASAPGEASAAAAFHTITVTLCARDRDACLRAGAETRDAAYRIAFGSGVGTVRTRAQATADLYREVRDRTGLGTRLAAERRRLEVVGDAALAPPPASTTVAADSPASDILVDAARALLEAVDAAGEVTIDVAHGRPGCKLSLGDDASGGRCLIKDATRPGAHDDDPVPRGHESKFGAK